MSVTDYVIDVLLILVIFRQVRPHQLTPRAALLPLVLLAAAGVICLRPVTVGGNDLALILVLAGAGIVLGALSGLADRIWPGQGRLWFRATALRSPPTSGSMTAGTSASRPVGWTGESAAKRAAGGNTGRTTALQPPHAARRAQSH